MKGMELSRAYFEEYGRPLIEGPLKEYSPYIAAGLVGEGSECFGYDDIHSQDHDFGPGFCIWVPDEIFNQHGQVMQDAYNSMEKEFRGYRRKETVRGAGRVGIHSVEMFYARFTGLREAPRDNMEWMRIPERFLATAVNGEVFMDNLGMFSDIRSRLRDFYPEDVVKKKLAARCAIMAQSGQYNYPRAMKRGDSQAAYLGCAEFVKTAMSAVYLLNGEYMPYYKWTFRAAEGLTVLKGAVSILKNITVTPDLPENAGRKEKMIENVCVDIGRELNRRGFTRTTEAFMQAQGDELMRNIHDTRLRSLHIMADYDQRSTVMTDIKREAAYEDSLINGIIDTEWKMFDKVQNQGGRAGCQDDHRTFYAMRYSQFSFFTRELLESIRRDLDEALRTGRNPVMEKYAYMMEYTDPAYFREKLAPSLPAVSAEKAAMAEDIARILADCEKQFETRYPVIAGRGRPVEGTDSADVSLFIYAIGELKTYSEASLGIYQRYLRSLDMRNEQVNPSFVIHRTTVGFYGYSSLDEAEGALH